MKRLITCLFAMLFTAMTFAQSPANAGFESWTLKPLMYKPTNPIKLPTSWSSFDSIANMISFMNTGDTSVTKAITQSTTIKHSGTSSARIASKNYGSLGFVSALLTNTNVSLDTTFSLVFSGGTLLTSRPSAASAWVQYYPSPMDSGAFYVEVINTSLGMGDSLIGSGYVSIGADSIFTQITAPIVYTDMTSPANLLRVYFTNTGDTVFTSSVLYVDDVSYSTVSGISQYIMNDIKVNVYPNPASNYLTIKSETDEQLTFQLITIDGKAVITKNFTKEVLIDVDVPTGIYAYLIKDKTGTVIKNSTINIVK